MLFYKLFNIGQIIGSRCRKINQFSSTKIRDAEVVSSNPVSRSFFLLRKSSNHVGFRVFSCFRKVCGLREPWGHLVIQPEFSR